MNKNISQLGQQLLGIWKQLGVNQRITVVATTLAVIVGMAGIAMWSGRADYALLYGKLDETEAGKVIAALDESKVPYKTGPGGSISVPSDKVYQVRMELAGKGIPKGEGVGLEIFDKNGFGISDFAQKVNLTRAIQGELARTIGQLDQIASARVMIVMPENRLLSDVNRKPTASVFVQMKGVGPLAASAVNSIRFLVANSVEGLQANNVSVVDNQGNVLTDNDDPDSAAGLSNGQLTARRNTEQYLVKQAQSMLEKVLGPNQAIVRISAEINRDTFKVERRVLDTENPVNRTSTTTEETTDSETASPTGGAPGSSANTAAATNPDGTPVTNVVAAVPVNRNSIHKKTTTVSNEVGTTVTNALYSAGGIKHLTASVLVAQRFEGAGTDRKAKPRSPDELSQLKRIVQTAVGITDQGDIELAEMPFNDQPAIEIEQQLEKQDRRQFWVDLALKAVYPALALAVIFMFWRAFKAVKVEEIPIGVPVGNGNGRANGNGNGNGNGHSRYGKGGQGVVTVEVLNQLIRENPANMTQAVRGWLNRGPKPNN